MTAKIVAGFMYGGLVYLGSRKRKFEAAGKRAPRSQA